MGLGERPFDTLEPHEVEAFAWDEPDKPHGLQVRATIVNTQRSDILSVASKSFTIPSIDNLELVEPVVIEVRARASTLPCGALQKHCKHANMG